MNTLIGLSISAMVTAAAVITAAGILAALELIRLILAENRKQRFFRREVKR